MARTISTEPGDIVVQSRTRSMTLVTEYGQPYVAIVNRERVRLAGTELVGAPTPAAQQLQAVIQDRLSQQVTAGGITATVAQIAALVAQFCDDLEAENE